MSLTRVWDKNVEGKWVESFYPANEICFVRQGGFITQRDRRKIKADVQTWYSSFLYYSSNYWFPANPAELILLYSDLPPPRINF